MTFSEAQLESAIIELLEAEGYPHVLEKVLGATSSFPTPLGGNAQIIDFHNPDNNDLLVVNQVSVAGTK